MDEKQPERKGPARKAWDAAKGYARKQGKMFSAELGALGREGLNDARDIVMGPWGEGEKTPGTIGYPTQQEVTDAFGGTYEQRMDEARKQRDAAAQEKGAGKEKGKDAGKESKRSKGREMGD